GKPRGGGEGRRPPLRLQCLPGRKVGRAQCREPGAETAPAESGVSRVGNAHVGICESGRKCEVSLAETLTSFKNEPLLDFSNSGQRQAMDAALDRVTRQLGHTYPLIIGCKHVRAGKTFRSINPSLRSETIGLAQNADLK